MTMNTLEARLEQARHLAKEARNTPGDGALLAVAVAAVRSAGARMLERFDPLRRAPSDRAGVVEAIFQNDAASLAVVREFLEAARPGVGWVEDELEGGPLPGGEFWVVDPVEGNINHVQGLTEWGISATLVRDNVPVLTAIHEPVADRLYTSMRGTGIACVNGVPMRPSGKTELKAAIVTTGQAKPGETPGTYRRMGQSVTAMLHAALVVRMTVPATFQLGHVAAGHIDGFWQHSDVRSGLVAGALLVSEAGGVVTDTRGHPWTLASEDFLACAPGIHREAVAVLSAIA
jgi:myo-inositol-1(or 4)-monophosphatase